MINSKIKNIVIIAIFSAIFFILSIYGTIQVNQFVKVTLQNLPLYLSAMLFGSSTGALVGFIGMFLNQILKYGIMPTTILWILPHTIVGFLCGFFYKKFFILLKEKKHLFVFILLLNILITILNTLFLYIDSMIYGYYNPALIFGSIFIKFINGIIISFIYTLIIYHLRKHLSVN